MKSLMAILLTVCLATAGFSGALAQEGELSYASGLEMPVTWSDDRGNIFATMQVISVNPDWQDYSDNNGPDRGFVYTAVWFQVTNVSDAEIEYRPSNFSLLDGFGRWLSPTRSTVADGVDYDLFLDNQLLAAGESTEHVQVFELPADVPPGIFVWDQGSSKWAMVNLADAAIANSAIAAELNTPSVWTDDRGNVIATFQVSEVNPDWLDYAENYAPDRGSLYHAVHFTIANESDDTVAVNPNAFTIMDSSGAILRLSRPNVAEGAEQTVFTEGVELAPDESVNGMLVFLNFSGLEPTAILWQPENGLMNVVVVQHGDGPADGSGVEATPIG